MNFPIAPVFGCKQLFLVRPLTQAASIIEVGMQSKHYIIDNDHCMCCGNVVEGKIDLFTNIAVGRWLHLWERVTRRNPKKVIAQGAIAKSGCLT